MAVEDFAKRQEYVETSNVKSVPAVVKRLWYVCVLFTFIYFIVAVLTAHDNQIADEDGSKGSKGAGFVSMWTCLLLLFHVISTSYLIIKGKGSPLFVGVVLGVSAMLSQLFFVLMILFFIYGSNSDTDKDVRQSDQAFGSFSLFNLLLFGTWTVLAFMNKNVFMSAVESFEDNEVVNNIHAEAQTGRSDYKNLAQGGVRLNSAVPTSETDIVEVDLESETL